MGYMMLVLTCIWSRVYYRVSDSALGLYLMRWDEGPLLCAVLLAVVYCPKLAVYEHYNVTVYHWVSQFVYHWYHLLYVDLYTVYICYLGRCVEQHCGVFPCCILVLVIVSGVDVLWCQASWCGLFREGLGYWMVWGWGFYGWWGFSRASKILFGDMECSSFRWVFFEN